MRAFSKLLIRITVVIIFLTVVDHGLSKFNHLNPENCEADSSVSNKKLCSKKKHIEEEVLEQPKDYHSEDNSDPFNMKYSLHVDDLLEFPTTPDLQTALLHSHLEIKCRQGMVIYEQIDESLKRSIILIESMPKDQMISIDPATGSKVKCTETNKLIIYDQTLFISNENDDHDAN